jgi:hypothetical protein
LTDENDSEIKRLKEEELPIVNAALDGARRALQACRERVPPLLLHPRDKRNLKKTYDAGLRSARDLLYQRPAALW